MNNKIKETLIIKLNALNNEKSKLKVSNLKGYIEGILYSLRAERVISLNIMNINGKFEFINEFDDIVNLETLEEE